MNPICWVRTSTLAPVNRVTFLLRLMREHLLSYLVGAVLLGLTLWMTFAIPRYLAAAIDILAQPSASPDGQFNERITWILLFAIAIVVTRTGSRLCFFVPGRRVEFDLKNRILAHLSSLQRTFYLDNPSGAIISRLNNDINGVRMLMGAGIMMVISSVGTLSLAPYYMYQISPRLTLYCSIPIVCGFLLLQFGLRKMRAQQVRQMAELQNLSDFTVESFNGIDVLKAYRAYRWAEERFGGISGEVRDASIRMSTVRAYFMPLLLHLTNALKMVLVLVGGGLVINEGMSIGDFTAYMLYLSMLVPPLMGMTFMLFILQRGFTGLRSLLELMNTVPGIPVADDSITLPAPFERGIEVKGLRFSYPDDPETMVLDGVDLAIAPREVVGIFGGVGSGKSTLVNLLNGYLVPPAGTVFVEGHDIRTIDHVRLRERIVTVAQEPFLFSDTIQANIAMGIDDPPVDDIRRATADSALDADLERMPMGVATLVGEKGITLSGGQKQRVALARAAMKPCELLLLDDVLSAVDHDTERYLIERLYERTNAQSALLVSHRLSALERADRIIVLDGGQVVATGRHEELIGAAGPYRDAWLLQRHGDDDRASGEPC